MKHCGILGLALLLAAAPAIAADDARTYFDIGAKAYQAARYTDAAQAFAEAYRISNRAGLLFSLGQAHRMEFFARNDPARLRDAIRFYEEYLVKEPQGKRAADATDALSKLKPLAAAGAMDKSDGPVTPVAPQKPRVMISSPTQDVKVTFDGRLVSHPFIQEVEPGKHKVVLSAPGHEDYARDIVVDAKTGAPPLDVPLKERPALLVIRAPDGAEVAIDGRLQGVMPLPPLAVPSGKHFVSVTKNGKQAFSQQVTLARGQKKELSANLESTSQRTASWVLMGVGAGGVIAGGVLGYLALDKQNKAEDIRAATRDQGSQPESELGRYEQLRQSRDDFRLAAIISASAGAGVGTLGLMLHIFDPARAPLPPAEDALPGQAPSKTTPASMEISAAPIFAPGFAGGSVLGRF
ncbi:MAG: PEGA domain-containing protein [Myxococcales bacterium]|nr:PEGA domain-containing protein [Myxococcales bacterium]